MFDNFHHHESHNHRADVCDRLGENQTVQSDQRIGDKQHRQENKPLTADGKNQRCQTVSHALECVIIDKDNAEERSGNHQCPQHFHGIILLSSDICHGTGRTGCHENADDRFGKQEIQCRHYRADDQCASHAEPHDFCHLREIPCPVVEADQRLDTDTNAQLEEHYQHVGFHGNAHAAGGENVDVVQQAVQHQIGKAHQHVGEKHGNADREHAGENAAFHGEVLGICRQHGVADFQVNEVEQHCDRVADTGGNGCTLDTHAHCQNHNGIQNDVGHSTDHHAEHRYFCGTLALDQIAHGTAQHGGNGTDTDVEQIVAGVLFQILIVADQTVIGFAGNILGNIGDVGSGIGSYQRQDPADTQCQGKCCQQSHHNGTPEAEAADLFHAVVLSRSQRTGDKGTAADAEQISECHKDHKHRCRHGNRVHLVGIVGLSHENRVHHVVQHGDQHAQDRGDRQRCHCHGDRVNFKNGEFLFFYLHIWISFLEYIFGNTAQRLCDRCVVKFFVR